MVPLFRVMMISAARACSQKANNSVDFTGEKWKCVEFESERFTCGSGGREVDTIVQVRCMDRLKSNVCVYVCKE